MKATTPDFASIKATPGGSFRGKPLEAAAAPKHKASTHQAKPASTNSGEQTGVSFEREPLPVQFASLGGLDYLEEQIKNSVELPLLHPEAFRRYGAEPPVGVLLTGPTGVGKTVLASALFHRIREQGNVRWFSACGPELITSRTGETEEMIRNLFDQAKMGQPALLFIDQLDILGGRSDNAQREFEKRVASQLAGQIDALKGHQVLLIGATSKPASLDPSLRRPGRFDAEIELLVPNRTQRTEIFRKILPGLDQAMHAHIASLTPGYVPADVHQLLREAAIEAHRSNATQLEAQHFTAAVKRVQPTAKREGFAQIPSFSLDQIGGLEDVKKLLQIHILEPIKNPERYQRLGLTTATGIILYGAPGNGKSLLGRAIASQAECNFISVKGPELLNQYVGESERAVRTLFERARAARPVVLFLDECECLCRQRGSGSNSEVTDRIVNQFLTELDGVGSDREGVYVIAATNRIDLLDKAIMRPGRLEKAVYVPLPDVEQRADILVKQSERCSRSPEVDRAFFLELSTALEGFSGADLQAIVREAGLSCVAREGDFLEQQDFHVAARFVRCSVSTADLVYYNKVAAAWRPGNDDESAEEK